jgi:hypothetical protein
MNTIDKDFGPISGKIRAAHLERTVYIAGLIANVAAGVWPTLLRVTTPSRAAWFPLSRSR